MISNESVPDTIPQNNRMYPVISVSRIKDPSRFYAVPVIGAIVKFIMLIPLVIEVFCLGIVDLFVLLINSFIVLFTGKYWKAAYDLNLALIRMSIKISFFVLGFTNKYPGFSLGIEDDYSVDMPLNSKPNRLFAIPLFGGLVRILLLIPYFIYQNVINNASTIAYLVSWIPVLFTGVFPESSFEIMRDNVRISQSATAYLMGMSDTYPSFWVSMNHKNIKILLIVLGVLLMIFNRFGKTTTSPRVNRANIQQYQQTPATQNTY